VISFFVIFPRKTEKQKKKKAEKEINTKFEQFSQLGQQFELFGQ